MLVPLTHQVRFCNRGRWVRPCASSASSASAALASHMLESVNFSMHVFLAAVALLGSVQ